MKYIANILRQSGKPVYLAVNKIDNYDENLKYEYYELGLGEPILISSLQGKGVGDLLDTVVSHFPKDSKERPLLS